MKFGYFGEFFFGYTGIPLPPPPPADPVYCPLSLFVNFLKQVRFHCATATRTSRLRLPKQQLSLFKLEYFSQEFDTRRVRPH